jgi:uncharacterized membrane protein
MKAALFFHLLGAVVWVGGMFFAWMCLRPVAAETLDPPLRLKLWAGVFARFFPWAWAAVAAILGSGLYMLYLVGERYAPIYVYVMTGTGVLMMLVYGHVYFGPYQKLGQAVASGDWPAGGASLAKIRVLVGTNLVLGVLTVATATLGALL